MALLVPNEGETEMLQRILDTDVKLKLFTNDKTPAESDTVSSYTEATESGYSAITLSSSSWSFDYNSGNARALYAEQSFSITEDGTFYGYFVTNSNGTTVLWAERFSDGPYEIPSGGGLIKITPTTEVS